MTAALRWSVVRTLLASAAALLGSTPLAAQVLQNAHVRASFGPRGLVSVTDIAARRTVRLLNDDVAITIGADTVDSRTLAAPVASRVPSGVSYRYRSGTMRIDVTYELKPGWRFVSKQLRITALTARRYTVREVTLLRTTLAELPVSVFRPQSAKPALGTRDYGAAVRLAGKHSLLLVAQNPFLQVETNGAAVAMRYAPDMEWFAGWGDFISDRALIAPVALSGRVLPAEMTAEWRTVERGTPGLDEAEVAAFTGMVRAMLPYEPDRPLNVFVGWTANDYQIDVGTGEGRTEYKRLLDAAKSVGADYVLYAPSNSAVSRREESVDDWSWEHVLWLGLGQQIRKNQWNPRTSAIPPTVQEMLDAARARKLGLLAYVYPVLPFSQNAEWLVPARANSPKQVANLGNRALQDWLIEELVAFHNRTGIAGYSFDHTFLTYEGASRYAQWYGWRRVMETLRERVPGIVLDGRQAHHLYGPWSYLAGSYPHPTFHDEQPESFTPFPDLHFDRVSADRERYTAYRYRNYEFTPSELVPGYMTHQTSRSDESDDMPFTNTADRGRVLTRFRARDWDYLGWRYSVLSSIALGGWNNVINFIPARDSAEHASFREADRAWLRNWLGWTDRHKALLRRTRTILGQPALGKVDGTTAIDGDRGFIFLFNPDPRRRTARVPLDASSGLTRGGRFALREVHPLAGRMLAHGSSPTWQRGDTAELTLDGGSALVLEVVPMSQPLRAPLVTGAAGRAQLRGSTLALDSVRGDAGTDAHLLVAVPTSASVVRVTVNGDPAPFTRRTRGAVEVDVAFAGMRFAPLQPVIALDSTFAGGRVGGTFMVPSRVFAQLRARRAAWPIPWTAEDHRTTWLVPERLLLWVPMVAANDSITGRLTIDGTEVPLVKAYTAVRAVRSTFTGFYAALSGVAPDRAHRFELDLPALRGGQPLGVFFENVEPEYTLAAPLRRR
ncbi:MAG: hypothetical protein V4813_15685 [Gemmatimonadota bacterium]